jgi:hypothetical protein
VGLEELRENGVQDGRLTQFVVGVPVPHVDEADGVDLLHAPIDRKNTAKNEEQRTKNEAVHTPTKMTLVAWRLKQGDGGERTFHEAGLDRVTPMSRSALS